MPHMQRLTWSGIALHGGVVPAHPASHGCIRLPYEFAERLFDIARLGMRVIVSPGDVAPVAIAHPALFQPKADAAAIAAARAAEAEQAAEKGRSGEARRRCRRPRSRASHDAGAHGGKSEAQSRDAAGGRRACGRFGNVGRGKGAGRGRQDEGGREGRRTRGRDWPPPKPNCNRNSMPWRAPAMPQSRPRVRASLRAEAARKTARDQGPISVFISRKTQHLYVRQGFQPILDVPVTIQDPDRPIGTHVFTAAERTAGDQRHAMERGLAVRQPSGRRHA